MLGAISSRGSVYLIHLDGNRYVRIGPPGSAGICLGFSPILDGCLLFSGHMDGSIKCFHARMQALSGVLKLHRTAVLTLDFDQGSESMLSASVEYVALWNAKTLTRKRSISSGNCAGGGFLGSRFVPGSSSIVTGCKDASFLLWESDDFNLKGRVSVGDCVGLRVKRHCNLVFCVSPNGKWLAFGVRECPSVLVCDIESCGIIMGLGVDCIREVRMLQFLLDSRTLAMLDDTGSVCFADIWTGSIECQIPGVKGAKSKQMVLEMTAGKMVITSEQGVAHLYEIGTVLSYYACKKKASITTFHSDNDLADYLLAQWNTCGMTNEGNRHVPNKNNLELVCPGCSTEPCKKSVDKRKTKRIDPCHLKVSALGLLEQEVNRTQLHKLLRSFGEYPQKYRLLIWEFLLGIPHNNAAFRIVARSGLHSAYQNLDEKLSRLGKVLACRMKCTLSSLANWCPLFVEVLFLPALVFPWVKMFGDHKRTCLEVVITVICNWGRSWFEQFPQPPMRTLVELENLVQHHDPQLFSSLLNLCGGPSRIGWKLMSTLMSEVLNKQDWLVLWDHALTNKPNFFHFLIVSYMIYSRQHLMSLQHGDQVEIFLRRARSVNVCKIVSQAYSLQDATSGEISPSERAFEPLGAGETYPEFTGYPCIAVSSASEKRNRIQVEEEALMRRRWILKELKEKTLQLEADKKECWIESIQAKEFADQVSR